MGNSVANVNYREVKRKAAVGERIKIVDPTCATDYTLGDEFTVIGAVDPNGAAQFTDNAGERNTAWLREYVVLEPVISAVPTDPLYAAFRQFVLDNAPAIRDILPELESAIVTKAPAQLAPKPTSRAQVIAKATADVAELLRIGRSTAARLPAHTPFYASYYVAEFHVNREKRTVTALVSRTNDRMEVCSRNATKFTAKCSPADVFHAEIGKAIALRKALGLTVPAEYTEAPQPEPAPGAKVRKLTGTNKGATMTLKRRNPTLDGEEYGGHAFTTLEGGWVGDKQYVVIDDTDVDYGAGQAEGAAA